VRRGKTPVLTEEQTRRLIESLDTSTLVGLGDHMGRASAQAGPAPFGVLGFTGTFHAALLAARCGGRHWARKVQGSRNRDVKRLRVLDTLNPIKHEEEVVMKVVTLQGLPNVPMEGAEPIKGYTGPVSRSRQTIIQPGESANYNCSVVNFSQGCTTGWHTHNCDQVLVVTSGSGMVGNGARAA
jgi:hypothetical protein